jgi:hypothetical protein
MWHVARTAQFNTGLHSARLLVALCAPCLHNHAHPSNARNTSNAHLLLCVVAALHQPPLDLLGGRLVLEVVDGTCVRVCVCHT